MRKFIIKIVIALSLVGIAIGSIYLFKKYTTTENDPLGTVTIIVRDLSDKELKKEIKFEEEDTFIGLLEKEFENVRYEDNPQFSGILYDIEWIKTDFKTTYLAIYIDDKYATVGILSIKLKDGMTILLKETKL